MATYRGRRPQLVTKDDDILMPGPSQQLWNHSPTGFSWGYGGSGPAQLALALLYDVTKDRELSLRLYQDFKWAFVARWGDDWSITTEEIQAWIEKGNAYRLLFLRCQRQDSRAGPES